MKKSRLLYISMSRSEKIWGWLYMAFSLLALVCLMFATYFRSAAALGMEKCPLFLGCGFLGVYFSFAAAADPGFTGMFLAMGVWMLWQLGAVAEEA